jgi:hypothetical protein
MLPGFLAGEPIRCCERCVHEDKGNFPKLVGLAAFHMVRTVREQSTSPWTTTIIVTYREIIGEAGVLHLNKQLGRVKMQIVLTMTQH